MIHDSPKSGYDILKEFKKRTNGNWIPSKGTVYPLLSELEKDGLIRVKKIGKRSKRIYEATPKVRRILDDYPSPAYALLKNERFKMVFLSLFHGREKEIIEKLLVIWEVSAGLMDRREKEVNSILSKCLKTLEAVK
jgi:DNA-binding PadR family transcriptional regulator